ITTALGTKRSEWSLARYSYYAAGLANSCLTMAPYPRPACSAREKASVILDEAEALLDPVSDIDGFMLACLVDASTGMVLASRKDQDDISLPAAAAGAADIANVLSLLAGQLPLDGLEGGVVTFARQPFRVRLCR